MKPIRTPHPHVDMLVSMVKDRWPAALAILLSVGLFFTVYTVRQKNIYQADCQVEFAASTPDVSLDTRTMWRYSSYVLQNLFLNSQMIIMKSTPVLERVVTSLKLADPAGDAAKFQAAQRQIAGALSVDRVPDSQIFRIKARHVNPTMARDIANAAAAAYIRYSYDRKIESYRTSVGWMDEKLVDLKIKLEESQRLLLDFVERQHISNKPMVEGETANAAPATDPRLAEIETLIARLQSQKVDEELKLERLKEKYLPPHPAYQKTEAEIRLLAQKVVEQQARLQEVKGHSQEELMQQRKGELQFSILSRDVEVNKELYDALVRKHKETDIGTAIVQTDAAIIEYAKLPGSPVFPNKPLNIGLAWIIGIFFAVGYCWVAEFADRTLRAPSDVEHHFNEPLLAVIEKGEEVGEPYRILRTNLNFSFPKGQSGRLIMLTSPYKGEGKSTVTLNLGRVTAELGRRTLIIDADLRARGLTRRCHLAEAQGLSNYLVGEATLQQVIHPGDEPNLFILPAGPTPPQPSTLLDSEPMRALLKKLAEQFSDVFVDTPPVSMVIDGAIIASMMEGVVMLAEANRSQRHDLQRALTTLEKVHARLCGLVLNKFQRGFGNYYPYGHGYYQYGATEEASKTAKTKDKNKDQDKDQPPNGRTNPPIS